MPINVSEAIDSDTAEKITVERISPGSFVNGLYVEGATSTFKALASVQQPSAKQLEILPMGERSKNIMVFYCNKKLRTTDDKNEVVADVVLWDGERWKVIQIANWSSYGHTIAFGAREE